MCDCLERPSGTFLRILSNGDEHRWLAEVMLTIQIGEPSTMFAVYLHVGNVNPKVLSLMVESRAPL